MLQAQIQTRSKMVQSNTLPKAHTNTLQLSAKALQAQHQSTLQIQHHQHQQQLTGIVHQQQNIAGYAYYQEQQQRNSLPVQATNYYPHIPIHTRHSFHGQEEATIYQNCQSVSMEQHYGQTFARSPTRRPESPPPLRNYHQTMVLIPYNTDTYARFAANETIAAAPFPGHNILEYQQVYLSNDILQ